MWPFDCFEMFNMALWKQNVGHSWSTGCYIHHKNGENFFLWGARKKKLGKTDIVEAGI